MHRPTKSLFFGRNATAGRLQSGSTAFSKPLRGGRFPGTLAIILLRKAVCIKSRQFNLPEGDVDAHARRARVLQSSVYFSWIAPCLLILIPTSLLPERRRTTHLIRLWDSPTLNCRVHQDPMALKYPPPKSVSRWSATEMHARKKLNIRLRRTPRPTSGQLVSIRRSGRLLNAETWRQCERPWPT